MGCFLCFEFNHVKCWSMWFELADLVGYSTICEACWTSYDFDPFSPIFQNTWEMHWCPIRNISLSFLKLNHDPNNLVSSNYVSCACYFISQKIFKSSKKFAKSSYFKSSSIAHVFSIFFLLVSPLGFSINDYSSIFTSIFPLVHILLSF
jgi:hypothetical protein